MLPAIPSLVSNLIAGIVATGIFGAWAFLTRVLNGASDSLDRGGVGAKARGSGKWI